MDNALKALFRRLKRQHTVMPARSQYTRYHSPMIYFDDPFGNYSAEKRKATMQYNREVKEKEMTDFEAFMNTGIPKGFKLYLTPSGTVQLNATHIQDNTVLMTMTKKTITAHPKRASHIKKMLVELADREQMKLKWSDSNIELLDGIRVAFWNFENRGEVDDTKLVSVTEPRLRSPAADSMQEMRLEQLNQYARARGLVSNQWVASGAIRTPWEI